MERKLLTNQEIRQFNEQIQIPEIGTAGQEILKNSTVAVVGAGGTGSSALNYLAATGLGKLGIIDYGSVEEPTLHRQTIYGRNDLGKLKTIAVKNHLLEIFPWVELEISNIQLTDKNAATILQPYNLVIDATNVESSGLIITNTCRMLNIPVIYGSVAGFKGVVSSFNSYAPWMVKHLFEEKNQFFQPDSNQAETGAIAFTYGLIGMIMAMEAFKILINPSMSITGKLLKIDCRSYKLWIDPL